MSAHDTSRLNAAQKEAVTTLDGPVLIVAGPGTGKTTVLTHRIAEILTETDTQATSILAMTFTEAGVYAMRKKLYELIGATAYNVTITTIHGFCNAVIQDFSEYFSFLQGFSALNDIERIKFTQIILEDAVFEQLAPVTAKDLYIQDILQIISTMKREYVSIERFTAAIADEQTILDSMEKFVTRGPEKGKKIRGEYETQERKVAKYKELLLFYERYEALLRTKQRYDYEDMILFVLRELKNNPTFCSALQEKYQYLLVDEYQDTNDAQNTLIFTLAAFWGEEANIFVVGDDDQAIYRFQGASVKNIQDFLLVYPQAKVITLTENYRSQQHVLDASRHFIRHNSQSLEQSLPGLDKALRSKAPFKRKYVRLAHFHRAEAENLFIADTIKKLTKQKGFTYDQAAILVRNNADMDGIIDIFQRKKIPYIRKAGNNALDNYFVKQLIDMVRLVVAIGTNDINDLLLIKILHYVYLDIPKLDLVRLGRAYPENRLKTLWDYVIARGKVIDFSILGMSDEGKDKILEFLDLVVTWYADSLREPLVKMLEKIMHESGLLDCVLRDPHKITHLNSLNSFFAEVKALNVSDPDMSLASFLEALDLLNQFHIPIKEKELGATEAGVQIMTSHSSKGLEFDYVFIPQLYSGKWDNRRKISKLSLPDSLLSKDGALDVLEEDRRLLYVALTRAKKKVYLTESSIYPSSYGGEKEVHPSQFIDELPKQLVKVLDVSRYSALVQEHLADMLAKTPYRSVYINTVDEKEIIRGIVSRIELHPTGLNNYLECPMKYLLSNVLRIPSAIAPSLAYGNAYHDALEHLYVTRKTSLIPLSQSEFFDIFAKKLKMYPLRTSQYEKLLSKGKRNLSEFYVQHSEMLAVPLKTEHRLSGVIGGARIKGRVDRIDYVDESRKYLKVIDYKTGKALPANAFEGLHPEAHIDQLNSEKAKAQRYFHQLLFYKVVSDIDWWITSNSASVVAGSLLFVDPVQGQFLERVVSYQPEDVESMKALIIDTWNKITHLEFPVIHAEDHSCEYCAVGRASR